MKLGAALRFLALLAVFLATEARAQGLATTPVAPTAEVETKNPLGSAPGTRWKNGKERLFVSARIDGGFFFLRPRVSFGYGKPHYSWLGFDLVPIVSTSAIGAYSGPRLEREFFTVRAGLLYQYSYNRSYLPREESYDKHDIDTLEGPRAQYLLPDAELEFYYPLGPGRVRTETQLLYAARIPDGERFYIDTLRVVAGEGITLRARLGYEYFFPRTTIGIQPAVEVVWLDDRDQAIVRGGALFRWLLADEFQLRMNVLPVFYSPDSLGRAGAELFDIVLRWTWASR